MSVDVLEYRRCLAVQGRAEGYSTAGVADFLGVTLRTVPRWHAAYEDLGAPGLRARPAPGRPRQLTSTQEKIVLRWLGDLLSEYGFATDLGSARRLVQLIRQEFGVSFHPPYLTTWLRQRGYTPQKPRRVPREKDEAAIARWLAAAWPRIKRNARRRGACLIWLDESGVLRAPLLRRSWPLRGQPPASKYKARHREKVSVAAAFWLSPLRDQLHLTCQTVVNGYFTNVEVAAWLDALVQALPSPVIALWDCGTMHQGAPIRTLVEESHGRLDIEPLPAYAPELMPVEFLWWWLKYGRLCNFTPRDAHALNQVISREWDAVWDNEVLLASFFHQSRLPSPATLLT